MLCCAGRDVLEMWGLQGIQTPSVSSLCSWLPTTHFRAAHFPPEFNPIPDKRTAGPGGDEKGEEGI